MLKRFFTKLIGLLISISLLFISVPAEAKWFHAAKKSITKKILQKGFSVRRMKRKARYGKGVYASKNKKTVLKEKPGADSVLVLKESKALKKNKIDVNKLSKKQLKRMTGDNDLRGNIKKGIVGPKLGHKLGSYASRKGKVIEFKSVKDRKHTNIFVPKKVYQRHPRILRPVKEISN